MRARFLPRTPRLHRRNRAPWASGTRRGQQLNGNGGAGHTVQCVRVCTHASLCMCVCVHTRVLGVGSLLSPWGSLRGGCEPQADKRANPSHGARQRFARIHAHSSKGRAPCQPAPPTLSLGAGAPTATEGDVPVAVMAPVGVACSESSQAKSLGQTPRPGREDAPQRAGQGPRLGRPCPQPGRGSPRRPSSELPAGSLGLPPAPLPGSRHCPAAPTPCTASASMRATASRSPGRGLSTPSGSFLGSFRGVGVGAPGGTVTVTGDSPGRRPHRCPDAGGSPAPAGTGGAQRTSGRFAECGPHVASGRYRVRCP